LAGPTGLTSSTAGPTGTGSTAPVAWSATTVESAGEATSGWLQGRLELGEVIGLTQDLGEAI
jgi:hypothetical protein